MSYRLHPHKKHIIEFADGVCNRANYEVNKILHNFCDYCGNSDYYESDTEIEVRVESLQKLVDDIECGVVTKETINEECDVNIDLDEFLKSMYYVLENSDKSDGYVHMSWF